MSKWGCCGIQKHSGTLIQTDTDTFTLVCVHVDRNVTSIYTLCTQIISLCKQHGSFTAVKHHVNKMQMYCISFFSRLYRLWLSVCVRLTILKRVLEHVIRHTTGSHGHVGHNIEGVVASWFQVINDIASCIISNDNLIFLIV